MTCMKKFSARAHSITMLAWKEMIWGRSKRSGPERNETACCNARCLRIIDGFLCAGSGNYAQSSGAHYGGGDRRRVNRRIRLLESCAFMAECHNQMLHSNQQQEQCTVARFCCVGLKRMQLKEDESVYARKLNERTLSFIERRAQKTAPQIQEEIEMGTSRRESA